MHPATRGVIVLMVTALDQGSRAITVGLAYLQRLHIEWSPHPTDEDVRREYEQIWSRLGERPIDFVLQQRGQPYSQEQGTFRDDELNRLVAGGNYGYNPVPGYNESVPMTFAV